VAVRSADSLALNQTVQHGLIGLDGSAVTLPIPGTRATVLHFMVARVLFVQVHHPGPDPKAPRDPGHRREPRPCLRARPGDSPDDARAVLALWGIYEPFVIDRQGAAMNVIGAPPCRRSPSSTSAGVLDVARCRTGSPRPMSSEALP
jgi:hypothetical protein